MKRILCLAIPFLLAFACTVAALGSETNISGSLRISKDVSPSQITAQQDNYNPSGLSGASVLRLSTDASRSITGLAGGYDGRVIVLHNVGSNPIVLGDDSGSSTAVNRFALTTNVTLNADACAILQYDGTTLRWRLVGTSGDYNMDHGGLGGLADDDHTQYALLAGRSGGQTLNGGTAASENLTLKSTSHATEGYVQIQNSDGLKVFDSDDGQSVNVTNDGTDGTVTTSSGDLYISPSGSTVLRTAALATNATDGFLYIPSSAGKPTGTPTTQTGTVPLHADTTNNVLWSYLNSQWAQVGGAANLLTSAEQRTFGPGFTTSTLTTTADAAYWVYIGYTLKPITIKHVEVRVTVAGSGAQTAEVALASSPNPPNKGNQTLTKLAADGTLDALTGTGVVRNTSAMNYACAAGVHLWAGIRTNMATTQPTFRSIGEDYGQGNYCTTATAGALTGAGPWTGTVSSAAGTACPMLKVTLD